MNIARTLLDGSAGKKDILLQFEGNDYTFAELDQGICDKIEAINQLAGSANQIAVLIQTSREAVETLYAIWSTGKTALVLSPILGKDELEILLNQNKPEILFVHNETEAKYQTLIDKYELNVPVYNVETGNIKADYKVSAVEQVVECEADDSAIILFTSGSTGLPKGVTLTHGSVYGSINGVLKRIRGDRPRRPKKPGMNRRVSILPKPIFHISGLFNVVFTFEVGRIVNLMRKFDVDSFTKMVEETKTDSISINPTMLKMLIDEKDLVLPRLKSVKYARSGTMPLTDKIRDDFEQIFGIPVLQGYGQTEAGGEVIGWSAKDLKFAKDKRSSIGRPHPNVDLAILDSNGNELPTGEIGEVCVRGEHFMKEYSGNVQDNPFDENGFLHTGDLGYVDEDGFVFLTGRLKNMIITGGFNIYPEEVENALHSYPGIKGIAVAPVSDERLGEIPVALIQLEEGYKIDKDDFIQYGKAHLAPYKVPRKVYFVEAFPETGFQKLDRPKLKELAEKLSAEEIAKKL